MFTVQRQRVCFWAGVKQQLNHFHRTFSSVNTYRLFALWNIFWTVLLNVCEIFNAHKKYWRKKKSDERASERTKIRMKESKQVRRCRKCAVPLRFRYVSLLRRIGKFLRLFSFSLRLWTFSWVTNSLWGRKPATMPSHCEYSREWRQT